MMHDLLFQGLFEILYYAIIYYMFQGLFSTLHFVVMHHLLFQGVFVILCYAIIYGIVLVSVQYTALCRNA